MSKGQTGKSKIVKNPRKRKGEGEFKYEVRYAEADLLFHDNLRDTVGNLIQVINDAKSEMPTKKKLTKREALGSGLYRYSFDSSAFMKEWDAWAKKYFGES